MTEDELTPEQLILRDRVAKAIYMTHWKSSNTPTWEQASGDVREWVMQQADNAIEIVQNDFLGIEDGESH